MLQLCFLLLGQEALRRRWKLIVAIGLLFIAGGVSILVDLIDGVIDIATGVVGAILVIEGLMALVVSSMHRRNRRRFELARGVALCLVGGLILHGKWVPVWVLFAVLFFFEGALRIAASLIVRFPGWRLSLGWGVGYLVLMLLLVTNWPLHDRFNVRFCFGLTLVVSGIMILRGARQLRRLPAPPPSERQAATSQAQPLIVHVWSSLAGINASRRVPIVNRYIVAVSQDGKVSTGHAAMQCGDDLYISHHPFDPMVIAPSELMARLQANPGNDVPGKWFPSYELECAAEVPSSFRIRFRRYDSKQLQAFWQSYKQDTTYNLTHRNCSVVVAQSLDAALTGVFAGRPFWPTLLRLLRHPDLWLASTLRKRAESMAWTPGIVLDYATALRRITEPRRRFRLGALLRLYRRQRRLVKAAAGV